MSDDKLDDWQQLDELDGQHTLFPDGDDAVTAYRYRLERSGLGATIDVPLCWVMLNPSTADDTNDDPTIRRIKRFTKDAGHDRLIVVNLFAARTTRPVHLMDGTIPDPVGVGNAEAMADAMRASARVVMAWGAAAPARLVSHPDAYGMATWLGHYPLCLGVTADGSPRHPLYVKADQPLVPYQPRTGGSVPAQAAFMPDPVSGSVDRPAAPLCLHCDTCTNTFPTTAADRLAHHTHHRPPTRHERTPRT